MKGKRVPKIWPTNKFPQKAEAERMYKVAYYLDKGFLRPMDLADYGLDIVYLKECGEVRMKKDWNKVRPHVPALWERMNSAARAMYLYSYLCEAVDHVKGILGDLSPYVGGIQSQEALLGRITDTLFPKFPKELQEKIQSGFGKEWARE